MEHRVFLTAFMAAVSFIGFFETLAVYSTEASETDTPPLELRLIIDPEFNKTEFGYAPKPDKIFPDFFSKPSAIFNQEIGRGLKVASIEHAIYDPSPKEKELFLNTESIIKWLKKESERYPGIITVFVTTRFLLSPLNLKTWSGYGDVGFLFFHFYEYDIQYTTETFLHELGHVCGADHSREVNSFMNPGAYYKGVTYGDKRQIIKQNCGHK